MTPILFVIICGLLSVLYAVITTRSVLSADQGSARMQEIAGNIREGAQAYLARQYKTIAIVGVVVFLLAIWLLSVTAAIGFFLAWLKGWPILVFGFVGMFSSVFYTAPPIRFGYRGFGELMMIVNFGPVIGLGSYYVQCGRLDLEPFLVSLVDQRLKSLGGGRAAGAGPRQAVFKTPMPGMVVAVMVEPGAEVAKGQPLLTLEAMKMRNDLKAPRDGRVKSVAVKAGQTVAKGDVLVELEA